MRPSSTPTATTSRALHPIDLDAATDDAWILVALHERVERRFDAYEAAEGSHAAQHRAVDAISRALATHAAVQDELLYPAARAYTARHDGDVDRQPQQDHLLDLVLPKLRRRLGPAEPELLGQRLLKRVGQLDGRPRRRWWPCRSRSRFQAQGAGVQRHAAGSSGSPSGSAAACRGFRSTGAPLRPAPALLRSRDARRLEMILLAIFVLLIALDLAAWRWGHDSRDGRDWTS